MVSSSSTVKLASEEVIDRFLDNVHVWHAILEMLPVKDRIRLEMTNKRLHILMLANWMEVTSFDVKCLAEMSNNPSINKNRWAAFVSICVNRIGDGLRSLTIRDKSPIGSWTDSLPSIGEGCPNIETINFLFEGWKLDIRLDSFSRLKTITVSTERGDHFASASASVFLSIPTSIEVIRGLKGKREEPFKNAAQMEGFFAHRPSLREVELGELWISHIDRADIFRVIAERCPHLKSIKLSYTSSYYIDFSGVVALESMKELCIPSADLNEMQIVTICDRSPLVEVLEFRLCFSSNIDLQSAALNALGALTKLRELRLLARWGMHVLASSLVIEFVRELARNSGASLRHLCLPHRMSLPTAAIEALANGCGRLRRVYFAVRVGETKPASIRFLIDCTVAHPSWITQTDEPRLLIRIYVERDHGDEYISGRAAFNALAAPAANLPSGVQITIRLDQ